MADNPSITERNISTHTTIRLHKTTHERLKNLKPEALTYDELISELIDEFENVRYNIEFEHNDS